MDPCMPPPDHHAAPDPNAHHALAADGTPADEGVPEEFLHPCCQKDLQEKRVRDRVLTKVRAADRAAQALARRKGAVFGGGQGAAGLAAEWARHRHEHGSGCCELMEDYPALAFLRMDRGLSTSLAQPEPQDEEPVQVRRGGDANNSSDEEEEDSDDELLRELEGEESGGFMEVRMAEMMRRAEEAAELRHLGVGLHTELPPPRILHLAHLRCPALVAHLYHPHSPLAATMDLLLESLAGQYPGTRFVRCPWPAAQAAGVDQRLRVPPSAVAAAEAAGVGDGGKSGLLLALRDGCLVDACGDYGRRFGERGGAGAVYVDALEQWLRHCQVLVREAPDVSKARRLLGALERRVERVQAAGDRWEDAGGRARRGAGARRGGARDGEEGDGGEGDEDSEGEGEEESYYECGLAGCRKAFAHSHVGLDGMDLPREFGSGGAGRVV